MFKKIALATALVATASFATWDKFPVLENHKGEAKVTEDYGMQDKASWDEMSIGARFTVIPNLELGLVLGYHLFSNWDGDDLEIDGLTNLPIMVRYQFMPTMNAFLDVTLPIGNEDVVGDDGEIPFHFGVQYSQKMGIVDLGTELGLQIETAGDDKTTPPWTLNLGAEGDFAVSQMFTPYVGIDLYMLLGKFTFDGDSKGDSYTGDLLFNPYLGLGIQFNQMLSFDINASFLFGNSDAMKIKSGSDEVQTIIEASLILSF